MELTVVIPARNEESNLPGQLEALLAQTWDAEWEILVVDNGSTDGTADVVLDIAASDSRLALVSESTPGICHARNAGIAKARGQSVVICDADDLVSSGWLAAMGNALREHDLVTGPQELDRLNPAWLADSRGRESSGRMPSFHGLVPFPNGNNMGFRRSLVDLIGEFDQRFIGAEDVEFGLRARLAGVDIYFEPSAVVHYAYRSTAKALWRQGFGYGRARPAIARELVKAGRLRPAKFAGWKSWAWLVLNAPTAISSEGRAKLAWVAGNRVGHLAGSIQHRTLLL